MKTLTTIDFLSAYRDIVLDGICVPDYLRPKGNQTFTRVDVVRTYNKLTWLDYIEMPKEANKESFLKFITLIGIIRNREGEGVYIEGDVLPLISDIIGADEPQCLEEIFYGIYLLTVCQDTSLRKLYDGEEGIHIPDALPSFLQERQNDREGFAGNFNYAWDYLAEKYSHSIKTRLNISETFKEKESIRLFTFEPKPLQELTVVLPSDYGKDDIQEVKTYTYALDEFMRGPSWLI